MADALVSGSSEAIHVGSSPVVRTNKMSTALVVVLVLFIRTLGLEGRAAQSKLPVDVCDRERPSCAVRGANHSPVVRTRKRLRIGYNSESFSVKSACDGINPPKVDEIAAR